MCMHSLLPLTHEKDDVGSLAKPSAAGGKPSAPGKEVVDECGTFIVVNMFLTELAKKIAAATWEAISRYHVEYLDTVAMKSSWSCRAQMMKAFSKSVLGT